MQRPFIDPEKLLAAATPNQERLEYARQLRLGEEQARVIYTATPKSLAELIGNEKQAKQIAKLCKRAESVQTSYLRVKKTVPVEFEIDLTQGEPPGEALFVRLDAAAFNPLPNSALEVLSGQHMKPEQLQTDHFLIHNINLVSYEHDMPFQTLLSSNLHRYAVDLRTMAQELEQYQKYLREEVHVARFESLPLPDQGFLHIGGGPIRLNEFPTDAHRILRAQFYLEPPSATLFDAITPENLLQGIHWFTAAHPADAARKSVEFGCFSYAHILAVHAATTGVWQHFNLLIKPFSTLRPNDTSLFVAERETINLLMESVLKDLPQRAPRCPSDGLVFGLRRTVKNKTGWLHTAQVFPKTLTSTDLQRKYHLRVELELDYSLAPKSIGRHTLLVAGAKTTGFTNAQQHAKHLKEKAQFEAIKKSNAAAVPVVAAAGAEESKPAAEKMDLDG